MPFMQKIQRIKTELSLDPDLSIRAAVQKAQEMLGVQPQGTLTSQLDDLLRELGDPPAPPVPPPARGLHGGVALRLSRRSARGYYKFSQPGRNRQ